MPCYLFTYHAYASWLPDHVRGYVKRRQGVQPQDIQLGQTFRQTAVHEQAEFDLTIQRMMLASVLETSTHIQCRVHGLATDPTHIHLLTSWVDPSAAWQAKRNSFKRSITMKLRSDLEPRRWFSRGASRKRVLDLKHFEYLMTTYLPQHRGLKWIEGRGEFL